MTIQYSPIFGYRKHRALYILEDFCNKYYDRSVYEYFVDKMPIMYDYLCNHIHNSIMDVKTKYPYMEINIPLTIENLVAKFIGGQHTPNGEFNFPDHIVDILNYKNVHLDTKTVMVDNEISYNNSCGQIKEIANHILNHYNGNDDEFYKSFVVYVYYTSKGEILDIMVMPMVYCIKLRKFDWDNLDSFYFSMKSIGNFNVEIGLPSYLQKTGMLSLEEKELAIGTATYNYFKKYSDNLNE